jgi:hypothetical protein
MVLAAYPNYSKDGMSALTKLSKDNPEEYKKLFTKARLQFFLSLFSDKKEGQSDEDIRLNREAILLRYQEDIEREYEGGKRTIRRRHNNEQVEIVSLLAAKGIEVPTEQDYVDLPILKFIGEIKIEPSKQDYATALGELQLAEWGTGLTDKFIISVGRKTPKNILARLTEKSISAFSKFGKVITADNHVLGHEELRAYLISSEETAA